MAQDFQTDGDSMRFIDQVRLLGKTGFRADNPKKSIIRKKLYRIPNPSKPLSSQRETYS
jgi:hypothetical protein